MSYRWTPVGTARYRDNLKHWNKHTITT